MKVVRNIKTKEIVYSQKPEFEPGMGVACAVGKGRGKAEDLEEVEVLSAEYEESIKYRNDLRIYEKRIQQAIRELAVSRLESQGVHPPPPPLLKNN